MGNGTVQHESCNSSGLFCRTARGFAELQLEGTRRRNRAQQRCLLPTPMHPTHAATRRTGVATIPHASPGAYPQIHGLRAGFPKRYGVAPAADAGDCTRRFPTLKSGNRNLLRGARAQNERVCPCAFHACTYERRVRRILCAHPSAPRWWALGAHVPFIRGPCPTASEICVACVSEHQHGARPPGPEPNPRAVWPPARARLAVCRAVGGPAHAPLHHRSAESTHTRPAPTRACSHAQKHTFAHFFGPLTHTYRRIFFSRVGVQPPTLAQSAAQVWWCASCGLWCTARDAGCASVPHMAMLEALCAT